MILSTAPAEAFWVRLSPHGLSSPEAKRLGEPGVLENYIDRLRPPLPGVSVIQDGESAVVKAEEPTFKDQLDEALKSIFTITTLTPMSWRVSWNTEFWSKNFSEQQQKKAFTETAESVRSFLGDPLHLNVYAGGDPDGDDASGVHFVVRDPGDHAAFIKIVRNKFGGDASFVESDTDALVVRLVYAHPSAHENTDGLPNFELMTAVGKAVSPESEVRIVDEGVVVQSKETSRNAELASIVRDSLKSRTDISMNELSDGSLSISLLSGAHLGITPPDLSEEKFLGAAKTQIETTNLHPMRFLSLGTDRVQAIFANEDRADRFCADFSKPSGFTIRVVDDPRGDPQNGVQPAGDEQMKLPSGEVVRVNQQSIVTGDMIADAVVGQNEFTKRPVVEIRLTDEGRERFAAATRLHAGERMAIIVDNAVVVAPVIREAIVGGQLEIDGGFTPQAAAEIVKSITKFVSPTRSELLLIANCPNQANNAH